MNRRPILLLTLDPMVEETIAEALLVKSLRPVGRKIVEANVVLQTTPEPWAITKISEDVLEFGAVPQPSRQQRAA